MKEYVFHNNIFIQVSKCKSFFSVIVLEDETCSFRRNDDCKISGDYIPPYLIQ